MNLCKTSLSLLLFLSFSTLGLSQVNPQFSPIPTNFGIDNPNAVYALDINYDDIDIEKQVFHLFLPDTVGSYPLVVYIHGGGFTGGNPGVVISNPSRIADIKYFLENGFAYASFGYRLINTSQADTEGVIKSLNDSKRALQFVRHYADELNINPDKIALVGGSAGAGTSLWLGTRSDMANPDATDPVLQESTRVCAVVANGSQATYDLYKWETEVYNNFDGLGTNYTLDSMANLLGFDRASNFYGGLDSVYQLVDDPALIQYREDVDMLFHMSNDDPPIYIYSQSGAVHPSDDLFHHSFHGREINAAALAVNLSEVKAFIPALSINTTEEESRNDFLIRHLNGCALTTNTVENELIENTSLSIYPNPASTTITIELLDLEIELIEVYTVTGKLVSRYSDNLSNIVKVSTASLNAGLYNVVVTSSVGNKISRRLIIN